MSDQYHRHLRLDELKRSLYRYYLNDYYHKIRVYYGSCIENAPIAIQRSVQALENALQKPINNIRAPGLHVTVTLEKLDDICAICMREYEENDEIGILGCRHEYHAQCITSWLIRKNNCPVCRSSASLI